MPSSIAHMLIAHKAVQTLRKKNEGFAEFADMLDDTSKNYKAYVNLGSIGPDLYCYSNLVRSAKDMIIDAFADAQGVTPWSYHLHAIKPNEFSLKLIEIMFKDVTQRDGKIALDDSDRCKLAYIAGHLTHIAADQIIHPIVGLIAGPYYRSGENRRQHRQCEVFQDYFLYTGVYGLEKKEGAKYDFFEQNFSRWVSCTSKTAEKNTEDWFRYFLQRGFAETYSTFPPEEVFEKAVDNLKWILRLSVKHSWLPFFGRLNPYEAAARDYTAKGIDSVGYRQYISSIDYIKHYRLAVELAVIYLIALYEVYQVLKNKEDFNDFHRERFKKIVRNADLDCPLEHNIFQAAVAALCEGAPADTPLSQVCLLTENQVFGIDGDEKVVKA